MIGDEAQGNGALPRLPVHGFVLAGGGSVRMGRDKAVLQLGGVPLVAMAVSRLRSFCTEVSLLGNREDLAAFAPVIREQRVGVGPGAGMEAGLAACRQGWALFTPVDVPFVPDHLLRRWATAVLARAGEGCEASYMRSGQERQPAFCMVRARGVSALNAVSAVSAVSAALDAGERRLERLLGAVAEAAEGGHVWAAEAGSFAEGVGEGEIGRWFRNLNTPADMAWAEGAVGGTGVGPVNACFRV